MGEPESISKVCADSWECFKGCAFVLHPAYCIILGLIFYCLSFHAMAMEIKYSDSATAGFAVTTFIIRTFTVLFYIGAMCCLQDREGNIPNWAEVLSDRIDAADNVN